jgi:CRISPR-associated protein Csa1
MYFLSTDERQLLLKALLPTAREQIVADELRGWSWHHEPMSSPYTSIRLGVAEVASGYCSTGRDLWLRHVTKIKVKPNEQMLEGKILHGVMAAVISKAKKLIWTKGLDKPGEIIAELREFDEIHMEHECSRYELSSSAIDSIKNKASIIWTYESSMIEARLRESLSRQPYAREDSIINSALPVVLEQRLDGGLLGLSKHLSVDAYQSAEPMVLELKFGQREQFHKVQVAGYALVAESLFEYPVNLGCIVYPAFTGAGLIVDKEFFLIDEELRQTFLERRDERMRMVVEELDPGLMEECPLVCPLYSRCHATPQNCVH